MFLPDPITLFCIVIDFEVAMLIPSVLGLSSGAVRVIPEMIA